MKKFILIITIAVCNNSNLLGQVTNVDKNSGKTYSGLTFYLKSDSKQDYGVPLPNFQSEADSALFLAAKVLNSQQFRDSIYKYTFPCKNYLDKCKYKCADCKSGIIAYNTIIDSLYRLKRDSITLFLHNDGECNNSFGYSYEDDFEINSHFITIDCDDKLPFAYKYAYHICHEYLHIVGFYHYLKPKKRVRYKDIAEATGWIAYYIIKDWVENKKEVFKEYKPMLSKP